MSSSPDPLSFITSSPSKSAAMRRSAKRATPQPLARLSPNVQRSDPFLEIPDLGHVSPSKSITMTTPRAAGSSPWRIKVTVEAQPHDEHSQDENSLASPTGARAARIATQTTTIPLNDANGSSPLKRRGRPRKSDTLPATQTTTIQLNDANGSSPTKKRGRPRKSDTTPAIATQTTTVPLNDANGSSPVKRNGKAKKGTPVRKPRKSITRSPEDSEVDSSLSDASYHPSMRAPVRTRRSVSKDVSVPEPIRAAAMYGPRSPEQLQEEAEEEQPITSSSSIGQRRRSARESSGVGDIASDTVFKQMEDNEQTPKASSSRHVGNDEDMWKSMISHHEYESDPTAEEESNSSDDELDIVMPDQTIGETTMLHSEEFSMVSLDSLPSMKIAQNGTSPAGVSQAASRLPSLRTDPIPQARRQTYNRHALSSPLPEINDSIASVSFMPSSPPIRFAAHTPPRRHNTKSPSAPPAIQQVEISPSKAETPKLVNVVKAGIALQGVVNGNNRGTQDRRPSDDFREEAQRARLDDMFSDFGSGTKRELQAGLRLGQQLAERARSRPTTRESTQDPSREASVERPATRGSSAASDGEVFDGPSVSGTSHQDSSHHRLPTPDDEDYALASPPPPPSQLFAQQPDLAANPAQTQLISPARSQASPDAEEMQDGAKTPPSTEEEDGDEPQSYQDSELQREPGEDFDVYWQRRRETISRKIDEAGSSQVIVLSSDRSESSQLSVESSQNALDGDIWEEEGSPLKQQIMFSSPSAVNSSPYHRIEHTIASSVLQDGDTMAIDEASMSSDTRQLRQEVATRPLSGRTRVIPPSPAVFGPEDLEVQRQIENELTPRTSRMKTLNLGGNNHRRLFDDNSDPTLESEPSIQVEQSSYLSNRSSGRSTHRSRDSQVEQTYVEEEQPAELSLNESRSNMTALNVNKERRPLFEQKARMPLFEQQKPIGSVTAPPVQLIAKHAPQQASQPEVQPSGGLFGRLWTAMGSSTEPVAPQVPLHPLASRYNNLPKIAPWTKTHWDTLDRIYQRYKRHPEQFSPQDPLNKTLLAQKYQWQPGSSKTESVSYYTNVKMQNWNYTVKITSELLVCCAIFMQLLTLKDAAEYRRTTGKDIVRGNFMQKDRTGDPITLRDVIARMFGVVGGEMIRADEKRGICVRRDLDQLKFRYPWVPGWWDEMGRYLHD
ncbi:hypothetical protein SLS56_005563 [Neofusicoccum ribis]|uniref:AT DNA binding protein n=1 Tax=Neofusicoccum ribis TaxID=45134 RepID=A0ABR3ST52_9PEZI